MFKGSFKKAKKSEKSAFLGSLIMKYALVREIRRNLYLASRVHSWTVSLKVLI